MKRFFCFFLMLLFSLLRCPFCLAVAELPGSTVVGNSLLVPEIIDLIEAARKWVREDTPGFENRLLGLIDDDVCRDNPTYEGRHHFSEQLTTVDGVLGHYYICEYCGKSAGEVLEEAEQEYVASLPAQTVTSDGGFLWYPGLSDIDHVYVAGDSSAFNLYPGTTEQGIYIGSDGVHKNGFGSFYLYSVYFCVPVSGTYTCIEPFIMSGSFSGTSFYKASDYLQTRNCASAGTAYEFSSGSHLYASDISYTACQLVVSYPVYSVTPSIPYNVTSTSDDDTYNIGTRASSITGNFGIVNSNGEVTQIDTQSIVNEGDSTYYNPVTNTTENFTDWTYDYSDRSYTLTTEEGDTTTITYGDEYVTYSSGGNTTNIYYITNNTSSGGNGGNSGNGGGGDTPVNPPHQHSYTGTVTIAPTCTRAGVRTFTCSGCGESYTENIPATGHAWEVVNNQLARYSSSDGELLQAGFTVYQCSVCGQQYRVDDESLPPAVIGQNTELQEVADNMQSMIPSMSGLYQGYLAFLSATFPYLPEEIRKLLYFGITSAVTIGIYKGLRRS